MKNIETILGELGIAVPDEQKEALNKAINENYKTVAEVEKKDAKITALTEKVKAHEEALKTFEGIDAEGLQAKIADLEKSLKAKDDEYARQLADRDFNEILKDSIVKAKGRNEKSISALLDIEALKTSQNQKEDIVNALEALAKAEDTSFLFAPEEPQKPIGNPIGSIKRTTTVNGFDELYKGNPFYHPKN